MKKTLGIAAIWCVMGLFLGFLVAVAGAGPGGASAFFIPIGIIIGICIAVIHTLIDFFANKQRIWMQLIVPIILILFGLKVFNSLNDNDYICDADTRAHAKSKVIKKVVSSNLDPTYLFDDPIRDKGCDLSFIYKKKKRLIHYYFTGGYKVSWWDCNSRGYCEHLKTPSEKQAEFNERYKGASTPLLSFEWNCGNTVECRLDNYLEYTSE